MDIHYYTNATRKEEFGDRRRRGTTSISTVGTTEVFSEHS